MADFPTTIYSPRTKENRSGVIYEPLKSKKNFAEDIVFLDDEVVAIETFLKSAPKMFNVPTDPTGLPVGSVWCDTAGGLNILKLVI